MSKMERLGAHSALAFKAPQAYNQDHCIPDLFIILALEEAYAND
ncbi:MAG: hypothetical protein ETSY1_27620 [Candidatus Entotheonella factor]|uniref:Uncharacterized protein n=1 Tax=Entotheonella factor TaxID=1429438 RepID=W4LEQ3_ENTF1|nr:MAG: hypothetical protein ETSY1_27620 [Candidatus Entotheonella factor]